jgi:hypothetical protein
MRRVKEQNTEGRTREELENCFPKPPSAVKNRGQV